MKNRWWVVSLLLFILLVISSSLLLSLILYVPCEKNLEKKCTPTSFLSLREKELNAALSPHTSPHLLTLKMGEITFHLPSNLLVDAELAAHPTNEMINVDNIHLFLDSEAWEAPLPAKNAADIRLADRRMILSFSPAYTAQPAQQLFQNVYVRFLKQGSKIKENGLIERHFRPETPYDDQILYIGMGESQSFIALCPKTLDPSPSPPLEGAFPKQEEFVKKRQEEKSKDPRENRAESQNETDHAQQWNRLNPQIPKTTIEKALDLEGCTVSLQYGDLAVSLRFPQHKLDEWRGFLNIIEEKIKIWRSPHTAEE